MLMLLRSPSLSVAGSQWEQSRKSYAEELQGIDFSCPAPSGEKQEKRMITVICLEGQLTASQCSGTAVGPQWDRSRTAVGLELAIP